jgi:hypothetical protein
MPYLEQALSTLKMPLILIMDCMQQQLNLPRHPKLRRPEGPSNYASTSPHHVPHDLNVPCGRDATTRL